MLGGLSSNASWRLGNFDASKGVQLAGEQSAYGGSLTYQIPKAAIRKIVIGGALTVAGGLVARIPTQPLGIIAGVALGALGVFIASEGIGEL